MWIARHHHENKIDPFIATTGYRCFGFLYRLILSFSLFRFVPVGPFGFLNASNLTGLNRLTPFEAMALRLLDPSLTS